MKPVVVVGSINTDFIIAVDALPKPHETLLGGDLVTAIGGKGLNQAVACARSGALTRMVGCVGDDDFGRNAVAFLANCGVDAGCVTTVPGVASGIASIVVARDGTNMIVVSPGANSRLTPAMVDAAADLITNAGAVVAQLEVPLESVARAMELARRNGVLTVLNPAPVDMAAKAFFSFIDLITPNETELMRLTGITALDDDSLTQGLGDLMAAGAKQAVVTLGEAGSATLVDGVLHRVPAFKVTAVDATGAGDIFNGSLVMRLVAGDTLLDAMRYASAASALSVTKPTADSAPSETEVRQFLSLS